MGRERAGLSIFVALSLLPGCATTHYSQGQSALRQGRYREAATRFEEVLARDPGRLDALVGLGIARYKEGAFEEAVAHLTRAVAGEPKHETARLYLALAYLRQREDALAAEQLTEVLDLKPDTRLATQINRIQKLLRQDYPLTDELRSFIAASLEDEAELTREAYEAQRIQPAYIHPYPFYPFAFRDCFITRHHRIVCF